MPDSRRPGLRAAGAGAVAVALAVLIVLLGVLHPPRRDGVFTDRLGPDNGELVAGYLARAAESLVGADTGEHWALVSFTEYLPAPALPHYRREMRIGQVLYQPPVPRVSTPLVAVPVPDSDTALLRSSADAAGQLWDRLQHSSGTSTGERSRRVLELSAERLRAECACVTGLVVRATPSELRALAERPEVRAVQALPADAVAGRFAVVPLRPDTTDTVTPVPDDGPVPQR